MQHFHIPYCGVMQFLIFFDNHYFLSSASIDSTAQTGHNGADWQEEIYQKVRTIFQIIQ